MKKILLFCALLTLFNLALWGFAIARVNSPPYQPVPAGAEVEEAPVLAPAVAAVTATSDLELPGPPRQTDEPASNTGLKREGPPPLLALTFDDGPSKEFTPLLLEGLRERGVHVTFFMVGSRAEKAPDIVLQAYEDGHVIGGHSYDHRAYFTKLSTDALQTQVQKTEDIICGITGEASPLLLRPPYGSINDAVAQKTGKANILWSIDPRDWEVRDAQNIYTNIMERATDGGVVILHDIYGPTVEGTLQAIDELLDEGWQFLTVPELYASYGIPLQAGAVYRSPQNYSLPEVE